MPSCGLADAEQLDGNPRGECRGYSDCGHSRHVRGPEAPWRPRHGDGYPVLEKTDGTPDAQSGASRRSRSSAATCNASQSGRGACAGLVNRHFIPRVPNHLWVAGMTKHTSEEGKLDPTVAINALSQLQQVRRGVLAGRGSGMRRICPSRVVDRPQTRSPL